jgi:hypothetical protein
MSVHLRLRSARVGAAVALGGVILLAPAAARAQGGPYGSVALSTSYGYDANLLSAPARDGLQSDEFSRTGPAIEAGYSSDVVRIGARYSFDADRFRRHSELNRMFAQEEAGLRFRFVGGPRFRLAADAAYFMTQTPADLNLDSLLAVGRTPATRLAGASSAVYRATERTDLTLDYGYARDALLRGVESEAHSARIGIDRRTAERDRVGVGYELRRFRFTDALGGRGHEFFHVITARWVHTVTPFTDIEIEVGPHIASNAIRPEIAATVRREFGRGELMLSYTRSQVTSIGEAGTLDVHRLTGGGTFRPARRFSISALPSYAYNARGDFRVPVYSLDADATFEASERVSIVMSSRLGRQEGSLVGPREATPHQRFAVQLVVFLLRTARVDGEWPTVAGVDE